MESYITTGRLAPDQVVIDMIADYIAAHKHAKGNIFDGFPVRRTRPRSSTGCCPNRG